MVIFFWRRSGWLVIRTFHANLLIGCKICILSVHRSNRCADERLIGKTSYLKMTAIVAAMMTAPATTELFILRICACGGPVQAGLTHNRRGLVAVCWPGYQPPGISSSRGSGRSGGNPFAMSRTISMISRAISERDLPVDSQDASRVESRSAVRCPACRFGRLHDRLDAHTDCCDAHGQSRSGSTLCGSLG